MLVLVSTEQKECTFRPVNAVGFVHFLKLRYQSFHLLGLFLKVWQLSEGYEKGIESECGDGRKR